MTARIIPIGTRLLYVLNAGDCEVINRGAGNPHSPGDIRPAIVVRPWGETNANIKVFCDGPRDYWATSIEIVPAPRGWFGLVETNEAIGADGSEPETGMEPDECDHVRVDLEYELIGRAWQANPEWIEGELLEIDHEERIVVFTGTAGPELIKSAQEVGATLIDSSGKREPLHFPSS